MSTIIFQYDGLVEPIGDPAALAAEAAAAIAKAFATWKPNFPNIIFDVKRLQYSYPSFFMRMSRTPKEARIMEMKGRLRFQPFTGKIKTTALIGGLVRE